MEAQALSFLYSVYMICFALLHEKRRHVYKSKEKVISSPSRRGRGHGLQAAA